MTHHSTIRTRDALKTAGRSLRLLWVFFLALGLFWPGCTPADDRLDGIKKQVVAGYAELGHRIYADSLAEAESLAQAVEAFVANPTADGLAKAKAAWSASRIPYLQSEPFRYYAGPIDDDDGPEAAINGWPLDENYIDSLDGTGILQDQKRYPQLTPEVLEDLNQRDGEENLSCGFHAIEFLLWGQDKSKAGPGNRPVTEFTTAPKAARRREFLQSCVKLLVRDLKYVADDWLPEKLGNYRAFFEEGWEISVQRIVTGMIFLGEFELAGQRLQVAYDTQEQEEEHSCFSDTTHLDAINNIRGISNIWNGSYQSPNGTAYHFPGFVKVAEVLDAELAAETTRQISAAARLAAKIPPPFDQAILGADETAGRTAIHALIVALEDQSLSLRAISRKLGYDISDRPDFTAE